jgi:enoyl-CoA hydratase/carnithine racemase
VVKEVLLSGRRLGADEALRHGLANRVVPAGEVLGAALALAAEVTVAPPEAVAGAKRALNADVLAAYERAMTSAP